MSGWNDRKQVGTFAPGPWDSVVVTLVDGKRADVCSVEDY